MKIISWKRAITREKIPRAYWKKVSVKESKFFPALIYQAKWGRGWRTQREWPPQNKQMNINHLVMESFIGNRHLDGWMSEWTTGWIRFRVIGSGNVFANHHFPSSLMCLPSAPSEMIEECSSRAWRMPLKSLIEFLLKRRVSFLFIQFSSVLHSNQNFIIIVIAIEKTVSISSFEYIINLLHTPEWLRHC